MDYPDSPNSLRQEFEMYRNQGLMDPEEINFFDGALRNQPDKWMELLDDEVVNHFFSNLQAVLTMGIVLYENDDFKTLAVNALAGLHHKHQLVGNHERCDVSQDIEQLEVFFERAIEKKSNSIPLAEIVTQDDVFWIFENTKNRYLICTLFLCVMKDFFLEPYIKYVQNKIALYEYTLGFWRPFEDFFEKPAPYQVFWVDMMSDLVSTNLPGRVFWRMFSEIE